MAAKRRKQYASRHANQWIAVANQTLKFDKGLLTTDDPAVQKHIESLPTFGSKITEVAEPEPASVPKSTAKTKTDGGSGSDDGTDGGDDDK